jgi:site-specific recombinase XerD
MRKKKLPEFLTEDESAALLKQPNARYPTGLRNLTMLRLMLDAGLRASELLALRTSDIDLNTGKLAVIEGKGKKDRALWLNDAALALVRRWRESRPVQSDLLFTTLKGEPVSGRYLREMVKRLGVKAGIKKDVHPHLLRHTFATKFYRETRNILMTQKALGHEDVSTTMIYTHVVDAELEAALRSFNK